MERVILLKVIDRKWMDHIDAMEELRRGMGLRGYAQHDPYTMYRMEGFDMFEQMTYAIQEDAVRLAFNINVVPAKPQAPKITNETTDDKRAMQRPKKAQANVSVQKTGRNDPCPCGSGKKYKNCCGAGK